jgi:hypothetical protein
MKDITKLVTGVLNDPEFNNLEVKQNPFETVNELVNYNNTHDTNPNEFAKINIGKLNKQIDIIVHNILIKLFELNTEKFNAVLTRIKVWGYELTLEEFILGYYVKVKRDNRLKLFVQLNIEKIIKKLIQFIEKHLLSNVELFDFSSENIERDIIKLKDEKSNKQKRLLELSPEEIPAELALDIISLDKLEQVKAEILNDLKKNNPVLEREI